MTCDFKLNDSLILIAVDHKFMCSPFYRTEQLIITRTGNHSPVVHDVPPPSSDKVLYNPVFELQFLHQVSIDVLNSVSSLVSMFVVVHFCTCVSLCAYEYLYFLECTQTFLSKYKQAIV